jgi:membrane associated rhomboid family serine protease
MSEYNPQGMQMFPPGVKNLLIINVLMFLAAYVVKRSMGVDLDDYLALHAVQSSLFRPWQYITYMFMHGSIEHIFFNMFALWMFGYILENFWGTRRFVIYYLLCGIGAGLVHTLFVGISSAPVLAAINAYAANPSPDALLQLYNAHFEGIINPHWVTEVTNAWRGGQVADFGYETTQALMQVYNDAIIGVPTVGASGSVYGILLAFGMMFPNERIYLYFIMPIKAKWFVIGYAAIELVTGVMGTNDGIAHFAHLGGMLVGLILILLWRKKSSSY